MEYSQKPSVSIISLMSQIGGAFNLFAGLSFIVLIEFCDMITRILIRYMNTESKS